jgi:hypothetical protein
MRQPLWNQIVGVTFAFVFVGIFRWMNPHAYASNSVYLLIAALSAGLLVAVAKLGHELRGIRARLEELERRGPSVGIGAAPPK